MILLRNDQAALRSAKKTMLDMIGRTLDDPLRIEAINGCSRMASGQEVLRRLEQFFFRTDRRCGAGVAACETPAATGLLNP
jgi:hypothetical protein